MAAKGVKVPTNVTKGEASWSLERYAEDKQDPWRPPITGNILGGKTAGGARAAAARGARSRTTDRRRRRRRRRARPDSVNNRQCRLRHGPKGKKPQRGRGVLMKGMDWVSQQLLQQAKAREARNNTLARATSGGEDGCGEMMDTKSMGCYCKSPRRSKKQKDDQKIRAARGSVIGFFARKRHTARPLISELFIYMRSEEISSENIRWLVFCQDDYSEVGEAAQIAAEPVGLV
ncbi:hypothetical protein L249_2854 [Ophiocordyceps polyrhachis-furcata BCC 54312]|uniref:Uncharacterized protein n=1 Tax=Ophiocordyceps polyrhachis-furcata BCC 54312 TaxID=1330021 RepID=A0A367LS90_9HYPO|nr:hypothetical protein L249_2854 [Ophiocordyceps polyrhachis-furcata BCC 54312]